MEIHVCVKLHRLTVMNRPARNRMIDAGRNSSIPIRAKLLASFGMSAGSSERATKTPRTCEYAAPPTQMIAHRMWAYFTSSYTARLQLSGDRSTAILGHTVADVGTR